MEEDELVDNKAVQKYKDRFKDQNLYCQDMRKQMQSDKLSEWREQMKSLEDYPALTKIYDRLGKDCKTLLQERDAARKQTNVVNKRKYAMIDQKAGHRIEYHSIKLDKPGEKKHYTTLDVTKTPQALKKRIFGDMVYTDKMKTLKLKNSIVKGRSKVTKLSKQLEVKLHPLQRDQNLTQLLDERSTRQIMKDFSIENLREGEIMGKQDDDLEVQKQKDLEHSMYIFALNDDIRSGGADKQRRAYSNKNVKRKAHSNTVNLIPRDKVNRFEPPSCGFNGLINTAVLDDRIKGANSIGEQIKSTRAEALILEDEVIDHQQMLKNGTFERLASTHKSLRNSDKFTHEEQAQANQNAHIQETEIRANRQKLRDRVIANGKNHELWTSMLRNSSNDPLNQTTSSVDFQQVEQSQSYSQSRAKRTNRRRDQKISLGLRNDPKYQSLLDTATKSTRVRQQTVIAPKPVGSDKSKVISLLSRPKLSLNDLNAVQIQMIIRQFTQYSTWYKGVQQFVISELSRDEAQDTEELEKQILNLHLDEEFLERLLKISQISDQIVCSTRANIIVEEYLFYILEGKVGIFDNENGMMFGTLKSGEFFEINQQLSTERKLKILQHKQSINKNDSKALPTHTCLMRFTLTSLVATFKSQIESQNYFLKQEIMRFQLFGKIGTKPIEELAEDKGVKICEYLPNEIIVEEGHKPMDFFCLVIDGQVRMEKNLQLKQNNIWPKSKNTWQKVQQTQNVACTMGDIQAYEHFGLREALFAEVMKNGTKAALPAQCRYSAKDSSILPGGEPSKTIKIIKIPFKMFRKVMPINQINDLLVYHGVDHYIQKEGLVQVRVPDESIINDTKNIMTEDFKISIQNGQREKAVMNQAKKDIQDKGRLVTTSPQFVKSPKMSSKAIQGIAPPSSIMRVSNKRDRPSTYLKDVIKSDSSVKRSIEKTKSTRNSLDKSFKINSKVDARLGDKVTESKEMDPDDYKDYIREQERKAATKVKIQE